MTNKDTKRIYTPPAASEFKFEIPEAQKHIKTQYSKFPDSKSKVSKDSLLVNILQSASDNLVSGYKGKGLTDFYTPGEWTVTITTAPSHPFNQGQHTSESLPLPDQSLLTTGQSVQTQYTDKASELQVLLPPFLLDAQTHTQNVKYGQTLICVPRMRF